MSSALVLADSRGLYHPKEAAVMVVGAAWLLMIGSTTIAAIILCGWRGAKSVAMDWLRMRVTFTCK